MNQLYREGNVVLEAVFYFCRSLELHTVDGEMLVVSVLKFHCQL